MVIFYLVRVKTIRGVTPLHSMSTTANDPQRKDAVLTSGSQQPFFHQHQHDVYVSSGLRNGEAPVAQFLMAPLAQRSALQWMQPTKLRCWHCTHEFDTRPYGIPIEISATNVYTMRGNFCSLACAKGFVTQEGGYNSHIHIALIEQMAQEVYDQKEPVLAAPNRYCLQCFGGTLSIDDFRKAAPQQVQVHEAPFVSQRMVIEVNRSTEPSSAASSEPVLANVDHVMVRGLRRPQPLRPEEVLAPSVAATKPLYAEFCAKQGGAQQPAAPSARPTQGTIQAYLK
jgi:hypothetical protein